MLFSAPTNRCFMLLYNHRQRFYEKHFGQRVKVFWLPDSFGKTPWSQVTLIGDIRTTVLTALVP
jgi:hypothetical protein